jgi:hypothetical protein
MSDVTQSPNAPEWRRTRKGFAIFHGPLVLRVEPDGVEHCVWSVESTEYGIVIIDGECRGAGSTARAQLEAAKAGEDALNSIMTSSVDVREERRLWLSIAAAFYAGHVANDRLIRPEFPDSAFKLAREFLKEADNLNVGGPR